MILLLQILKMVMQKNLILILKVVRLLNLILFIYIGGFKATSKRVAFDIILQAETGFIKMTEIKIC